MAAVLSCALLFSCNNEDFLEGNGLERTACDHICFGISPDENARTRGTAGNQEDGYTSDRFVLRSDDSADTLCVRAVVSEGIHASGFDDSRVITRGTPITKDNFYDTFHVLAYWKKNGELVNQFYMDEDAYNANSSVGTGDIWSTKNNTYYWPGAEHTLQFYAWAPTDINSEYFTHPQSPTSTKLSYNVPEDVTEQNDIVVAKTNEVKGDFNQAQPLSFKHICTAVRFVVGSQMQPGTITSVSLKGVYREGTFDMASDTWDLDEISTYEFTQTLEKTTTGNETEGTEITSGAGTFMMLPQTLPAGAKVEVVFNGDDDNPLTASIAGMEWPMGKTVTYKLSISPEYELEFTSEPETQDAHYEICTVNVRAADIPNDKNWELTASADDGADVTVQLEADVNQFAKEGFWIDKVMSNGQETEESARGTASLTGQGNGEHTVYVFLPENAGNSDRTVTLSLKMNGTEKDLATLSILQKCPADGWEQIDDNEKGDYGFNWNRKVAYIFPYSFGRLSGSGDNYTRDEANKLINNLITQYSASEYASIVEYQQNLISNRVYVHIDYSKLNTLSNAQDVNDGYKNTLELYKKAGSATTGEFEQALLNTYKTESGKETENMFRLPTNSDPTAVPSPSGENNPQSGILNYILRKNRYCLSITETNTEVTKAPYLQEKDLVWYLPAYGEFSTLPSDGKSSEYWSSTSGTENQAYLGDGSSVKRSSQHKVRAMRKKP